MCFKLFESCSYTWKKKIKSLPHIDVGAPGLPKWFGAGYTLLYIHSPPVKTDNTSQSKYILAHHLMNLVSHPPHLPILHCNHTYPPHPRIPLALPLILLSSSPTPNPRPSLHQWPRRATGGQVPACGDCPTTHSLGEGGRGGAPGSQSVLTKKPRSTSEIPLNVKKKKPRWWYILIKNTKIIPLYASIVKPT